MKSTRVMRIFLGREQIVGTGGAAQHCSFVVTEADVGLVPTLSAS